MDRLPPERLHRTEDIRAVFRGRRVVRGRYVDVHVRDVDTAGRPRMTVVAGRKVGHAVARNRAKRRLRAAARETGLPPGRDAVLVAKPGASDIAYSHLIREVSAVTDTNAGIRGERSA